MRVASISSAMPALAAGFVQKVSSAQLDRDRSGLITAREVSQSGILKGHAVQAVAPSLDPGLSDESPSQQPEPLAVPAVELAVERLLAEQTLAAVVGMMVSGPAAEENLVETSSSEPRSAEEPT